MLVWPQRLLAVGLVAVLSLVVVTPLVAAQSQEIWSGSGTFASGTMIETNVSSSGDLVLRAQPASGWAKYAGNPVLSPSLGWSPAWTISPDVLYENGLYKMWYQGCTSSICNIGYATSPDGTTWTPYSGNPVLPMNSSSWDASVASPRVIHDGTVYRMWYAGNGALAIRIGYATSSDGIHWVTYGTWPVFNGTMAWDSGAVATPAVVKSGSGFIMYFSGTNGSGGYGYSTGRATSPDGINWTEYPGNPVLVAQGGWEGNRVHPGWFSIGSSGYDLYYSGGTVGTPVQIGHATSPDGLTWTEDPANPILRPDGPGSWDQWAVAHPYLITVGTQTRMYFTGYNDSSNLLLRIGYAIPNASGVSYVSAGTWVSTVFDSGNSNTTWSSLSWTATTPPNTGIGASVQIGNSSSPDLSWTLSTPSTSTPTTLHLPEARYARVLVALVSLDGVGTPSLSSVTVTYERPATTPSGFGGFSALGLVALAALVIGIAAAIVVVAFGARRPGPAARPPSGPPSSAAGSFCTHCGAPLPFENRFCGKCGQAVSQPPGNGPPSL